MSLATPTEPTPQDAAPVLQAGACPRCGGPVEREDQFCGACGQTREAAPQRPPPAQLANYFRCQNCGAEVAIDPDQRSYTCAFCDSTYVVQFTPDQTEHQPPEFVIGFAVPLEEAMERFRRWLRSHSWFRPRELKTAQVAEKLRGVYLPFWSFSMLAESRWSAHIGEHWYRTETYTTVENGKTVTKTRTVRETEWWPLAGSHHRYYSHYLISGSRGLSQREADRIKPFHLAALRRYQPHYLAGWLCEEYSIHRDQALAMCREEFCRREHQNIAAFLPGDTHRDLRVHTEFRDVHSDLILLPVYLLSYRYRETIYRFLMNGQTGRMAGQKPWSWWKIGIAVGLAVAAVAGLAILAAAMG